MNQINQIHKTNQMKRRSFPDSSGRFTNDKSGLFEYPAGVQRWVFA